MNKWENRRFKDLNAGDRPRPQLPRALRKEDPLPPSTQFDDVLKGSEVRKQSKKSGSGTKTTD
jgi:hypothetical protein